jgi:hypothetical protein
MYEYFSFSPKILSSRGCFSHETCAVFRYSDWLAYFEISNQNHHRQTGYNYNILFQIIDNLLGRNTTRFTWKLIQYGNWITHNGLFWEGTTDTNYTTQNRWICDNRYISGKNRISQTITSSCMKIFQKMVEEWWFELNMTWCVAVHGFPAWVVKCSPITKVHVFSDSIWSLEHPCHPYWSTL